LQGETGTTISSVKPILARGPCRTRRRPSRPHDPNGSVHGPPLWREERPNLARSVCQLRISPPPARWGSRIPHHITGHPQFRTIILYKPGSRLPIGPLSREISELPITSLEEGVGWPASRPFRISRRLLWRRRSAPRSNQTGHT
jgi:hypothetical protein